MAAAALAWFVAWWFVLPLRSRIRPRALAAQLDAQDDLSLEVQGREPAR